MGLLSNYFTAWLFGIELQPDNIEEFMQHSGAIKTNTLFFQLGAFLLSAITIAKLASDSTKEYFNTNLKFKWSSPLIVIVSFVLMSISMYFLIELNSFWQSDSLEALQSNSLQQKELILNDSGMFGGVYWNIVILAIVPAICEEFLFRGVLMRYFFQLTRNLHVGVWLCAVLFSLVHFEYQNFLAILFMGAIIGYVYCTTGSIWYGVLLHFTQNAVSVVQYHYLDVKTLSDNNQLESSSNFAFYLGIATTVILIVGMIYARKSHEWHFTHGQLQRD